MHHEPGQYVDFGRERPFVRQLAQAVALVGLLAMATYKHAAPPSALHAPAVATLSAHHLPFAPVALRPTE